MGDRRISIMATATTNLILNADSYKASHFLQYPPNTTQVSSYIESRGGQFKQSVFFGLQMFIKQYLLTPITQNDIDEAEIILTAHGLPFNKAGWQYILDKYSGFLPIEIQALPEGTLVPERTVMAQVVNTDSNCAWLTSYIETSMLRAVWYPTTVATKSWYCKQTIQKYLAKTADSIDALSFKLHDFGARGATTEEAAAIGGLAHLVNFQGTDTLSALVAARKYYGADMAGFSIPAAEHSTITSWGKENETQAYENMLKQFSGPNKLVAVVSDSYDLWNAIDNIWGDQLRQQVINNGGTVVIRPDSGNPVEVVTETIERLMTKFGFETNAKGYRVLPNCVRVIQGDGVSLDSIEDILKAMDARKQSADNIAFGMGAELLQKINRDTLKFAMKTSAVNINNHWQDVYKDPITDTSKRSKKGRLAVIKNQQNELVTIREDALENQDNQLKVVYSNGKLLIDSEFEEIRNRTKHG